MARKTKPARRRKASTSGAAVTVRHYCQGIGDSHLLRFARAGGNFWVLIDCGVHSSVSGGSKMMDRVVADIAAVTGNRLDVIVVTHEHTDHVSAFLTAAEAFEGFSVGEVWMAWTENPSDPQARELDKFKQQSLSALQASSQRLAAAGPPNPHLEALKTGLDALLGFNFGVKGERVRKSRDAAAALAKGHVRYLEPSDPPINVKAVPGLRIYVLGPPRDPALLGLTERASEMYGMGPGVPLERALSSAFAASDPSSGMTFDYCSPFDPSVGSDLARLAASTAQRSDEISPQIVKFAHERYFGPLQTTAEKRQKREDADAADPEVSNQSWRRIDLDWLGISADLAMQLDDRTNNTSLVLAFEFTDTKRVLLFAADAQIGNWLSWQNCKWQVDGAAVTGGELLERTVFYKVGHHGSHNATARAKGLDLMTSPDLSAFVPTNAADAKKVGWGAMPYIKILAALKEQCAGRVVRADDRWIGDAGSQPDFAAPSGSILAIRHVPGLCVELDLA